MVGSISVWMDIVDDNTTLPSKEGGKIVAKVSRLGLGNVQTVNTSGVAAPSNPVRTSSAPVPQTKPPPKQEASLIEHEQEDNTKPPVQRRNSDKLISFDNFDEEPAPAVAAGNCLHTLLSYHCAKLTLIDSCVIFRWRFS